jgi:hypothetical protein
MDRSYIERLTIAFMLVSVFLIIIVMASVAYAAIAKDKKFYGVAWKTFIAAAVIMCAGFASASFAKNS